MTRGPYRGACIDTGRRRFPRILKGPEALPFEPDAEHILVANFLHDGKFWVARIPKGDFVEEFVAQKIRFLPSNQSHIQALFRARKGSEITLLPQVARGNTKPVQLSEIVWTSSALRDHAT